MELSLRAGILKIVTHREFFTAFSGCFTATIIRLPGERE
jgi:hypothetical protein